jgi:hypothetical protein
MISTSGIATIKVASQISDSMNHKESRFTALDRASGAGQVSRSTGKIPLLFVHIPYSVRSAISTIDTAPAPIIAMSYQVSFMARAIVANPHIGFPDGHGGTVIGISKSMPALIELGRFDEVIVAGKKAQRQNPSYPTAYRCLTCAFAHLGRDAEAREAAARVLEYDPSFTIGCLCRSRWAIKRAAADRGPSEGGITRMSHGVSPRFMW